MAFIILILTSFLSSGAEQVHPFNGRVIEYDEYRTPLYGASVWFPDLETGTITNRTGYFSFDALPRGEHILRISFVGYQTIETTVFIPSDENPIFKLEMDPQMLGELEVLADAEESVQMQQASLSTIQVTALSLTHMPRLLGEPDLIRMIQNLPGVKTESDFTGGFFVRGGRNDQNLILLDGVPVYNPWHLFGLFSAFNTEAIDRVELTKGVFPARFGSRISSVLDIKLQEGSERLGGGYLTVSPMSASFSYGRPLNQQTSYLISVRRTYMDPFLWIWNRTLTIEDSFETVNTTLGYYFYDLNMKVVHKFSPQTRLEAAWFRSSDQFEVSGETIERAADEERISDEMLTGWKNNTGSLKLLRRSPRMLLETQAYLTFYHSNNRHNEETIRNSGSAFRGNNWITTDHISDQRFEQWFRDAGLQQHITWFAGENNHVYLGWQWTLHHLRDISSFRETEDGFLLNPDGTRPSPQPPSEQIMNTFSADSLSIQSHIAAAYLSSTLRIGDLNLHPGMRYETYSLTGYHTFMPRLNANWQVTPLLQISAGYGHFSQYIHVIGLDLVRTPMDRWFWSNEERKPVTSRMATFGLSYDLQEAGTITIEWYQKTMNNLLNFDPLSQITAYRETETFPRFGSTTVSGKGKAYGVELFWEKSVGTVTGWMGYTLSWAWNQFSSLNRGNRFPSRTDKRHDLQVFLSWDISENWSLGALFNYKSGQPITFSTGHYLHERDPLQIGDSAPRGPVLTEMNAFRLPAYHRLDLNLAWKNRRWFNRRTEVSLNVINVYNRFNPITVISETAIIEDRDGTIILYPQNRYFGQLPILPVISLRIALGGDAR